MEVGGIVPDTCAPSFAFLTFVFDEVEAEDSCLGKGTGASSAKEICHKARSLSCARLQISAPSSVDPKEEEERALSSGSLDGLLYVELWKQDISTYSRSLPCKNWQGWPPYFKK